MKRREMIDRLLRLLGPDGLEDAAGDLAALEREGELPMWLERLVAAREEMTLPEVPAVVSQDLHRMFEPNALLEAGRAVLVRDSRVDRELVGVRGGDSSDGWSMTYTSAIADVVLDVLPQRNGTVNLVGHIMAHRVDESAYRATLSGPTEVSVTGDRLGRVRVEGLAPDRYTMVVGNGEIEVTLDADLGEVVS